MNKDYKIFTESEFNQRVKVFWNSIVKPEFPTFDCVIIQNDEAKRRTDNYGKAHYKKISNKLTPYKLSFSYRMLDGRFTLDAVESVIKHEIGHCLDVLRRGRSGHDKIFYAIGREFNFCPKGSINIEKSSIYNEITKNDVNYCKVVNYKYKVYCPNCGREWFRTRPTKITKNPTNYICPCGHHGLKVENL